MCKPINTTPETIEFIERYLSTSHTPAKSHDNADYIKRKWYEINVDFEQKGVDPEGINQYIKHNLSHENYNLFLYNTDYWRIISDYIKFLAGYKCLLNQKHTERLVVHHGDYDWLHGRELQLYRQLVCLCDDCHKMVHDKFEIKFKEIIVEKEVIVMVDKPISNCVYESPEVCENYLNFELSVLLHSAKNKKLRIKV